MVITILSALPCGGNKFFKAFGDVRYMSKRVADLGNVHLVLWVSIVSLKSEHLKLKTIRRDIEWSLRTIASMRARALINFLMRAASSERFRNYKWRGASTSKVFRQLESLFIKTLFSAK